MSVDQTDDVHGLQLAVHQIVFTTSDGGPAVAASSMSGPDAEHDWLEALRPFLGAGCGGSSRPSLAYIRFTENWAVVLHQTSPSQSDVPIVHALVGRADVLTAGLTLTLSRWKGWQLCLPQEYLVALRPDQLSQELDVAGSLRAAALGDADRLARTLGWLLQNPSAPLTVVGCPDSDRVPLLWALAELGAPVCPGRPWTFWTEAQGTSDWWPDIVFLSTRPDDAGGRILVDLEKEQWPGPEHALLANRLVFRLKYGYFPDHAEPVQAAPTEPGVAPVPAAGLTAPRAPEPEAGAPPPPTGETRPVPVATVEQATQLAKTLLGSCDAADLAIYLVTLEQSAGDADIRRALRTVLAGSDHGAEHVRIAMGRADISHVLERIVLVLFGPGMVDLDTLRGVEQAGAMVQVVDDDMAATLARTARQNGRLRQLVPAFGLRWVGRLDAAPPPGPVLAAQSAIGRLFGARTELGAQRLLVATTLVVLLLALALGFLIGRATATTAAPAAPVATTPSAAPSSVLPSPSAGPSAEVIPTQEAVQPTATAGAPQLTGSLADGTAIITGSAQGLGPNDSLWLVVERIGANRKDAYLDSQPCAVTGPTWTCTQIAKLPEAGAGLRPAVSAVVVRADPSANKVLAGLIGKANGGAAQIKDLPAGAAELARTS